MRKILYILKWVLIVIIILIVLVISYYFIMRFSIKNKSVKGNAISELREVKIGNYYQKILIEGNNIDAPVLLMLHGGPATPIIFGNGYRGVHKNLTNNYIVVYWDQYGCGNNRGEYDYLTVNDYIKMSESLVDYLKESFPNNELYIFGMSWGSVLGTSVIANNPDKVDKYISLGTLTSMKNAYEFNIDYLLHSNITEDDKRKIDIIKSYYSYDNLVQLQEIGERYNFTLQGSEFIDTDFIEEMTKKILFSPDYSFGDMFALLNNDVTKTKLFNEVNNVDILDSFKNIKVPTYIIQGKYDNTTPHKTIEEVVSNNSNFKYYELENSGHYLTRKDFDILIDYLIDIKNDK